MSLTISSKPNTKPSSSYDPVEWELTTTRTNTESYSITAFADDGAGFTLYTVGSHSIEINDTVVISGVSDSDYNSTQQVRAVNATQISTNLVFPGGSPSGGTLTRANTNVNIRAELIVFDGNMQEVTTISNNFTNPQLTFASAHGLTVNDVFMLTNTGVSSYDQAYDANTFSVDNATQITLNNVTYLSGIVSTGTTEDSAHVQTGSTLIKKNGLNISDSYHFDFSRELQSKFEIDESQVFTIALFYFNAYNGRAKSTIDYTVRWNEVIDISGLQTDVNEVFEDNSSSDFYTVTDGIYNNLDSKDFDDYTINVATVGTAKFLTDIPRDMIKSKLSTDSTYVNFLNYKIYVDGLEGLEAVIETYDLSGSSLGTTVSTTNVRVKNHMCSVSLLNLIGGLGTFFDPSLSKFDFWLRDVSTSTQQTEKLTVNMPAIVCAPVHVIWKNRYGAYDYYDFTNLANNSVNVDRSLYYKDDENSSALLRRGESVLGSSVEDVYTIFTGGLTEAETIWMKQLVYSSDVYVKNLDISAAYLSVTPLTTSQVIKKGNDLPEFVFNYRLSNKIKTHG